MKFSAMTILLACWLFPSAILAQRSIPHNLQEPELSPAQQASEYLKLGEQAVEKVAQLESKLAEMEPGSKRAKTEKKIAKTWDKAIHNFKKAIESYPKMFQAHQRLGWSYYQIGQYEAALAACSQAIDIAPNLNTAIASRAKTYLALDRPEGAKSDYLDLTYRRDELAGEVLEAMKAWLAIRRQDPAGVDPGTLDELQAWIESL